jgi:hypothetical protein
MRYFTYVPESIDWNEIKEKYGATYMNRMAYIVGLIAYLPTVYDEIIDDKGYVKLHAPKLKTIIGKYYLDYLKYLISDGIIETNNRYIVGKASKGYRYTSVYTDSELIRYDFTDKHIRKKLTEARKVKEADKKKYSYLYKWFSSGKLTIDSDAAFKLIKSHNLSEALKYSVDAIQSGIWRFKVTGEGQRLYTNLTNLKRELRQFLRYDGKELVELDIKSSQPYFFIKLIVDYLSGEIGQENALKLLSRYNGQWSPSDEEFESFLKSFNVDLSDLASYMTMIKVGLFYPTVQLIAKEKLDKGFPTDKQLKGAFFELAYSSNRTKTDIKTAFEDEFPIVTRIMKHHKWKDHSALAIKLQQVESDAMLNVVCKSVSQKLSTAPIFTIHDSILTTKEYQHHVSQIMADELFKIVRIKPILRLK